MNNKKQFFIYKFLIILSFSILCLFTIFISNVNASNTSISYDGYDFSSSFDLVGNQPFVIFYNSNTSSYQLYMSKYDIESTNFYYINSKFIIKDNNDLKQSSYYADYDTFTQTFSEIKSGYWTDVSVPSNGSYFVYSTLNVYSSEDKSNIFFQQTPQVATMTISEIAKVEELPKIIAEILKVIIPIGLILLSIGLVIYLTRLVISRMT